MPGSVYHVISRFVAKEWLIESAVERRMYLSLLGGALGVTDWRLLAYAVMSSHIHLGLVAGTASLRSWLRPMHTSFANWMNVQRGRIGAVFVRGPNVIDTVPDWVGGLINYVHYNPVRAGVVAKPADSDWTSHRAYVGLGHRPTWLDVDCGLRLAGFASAEDFATWSSATGEIDDSFEAARLSPKRGRGRPVAAVR